MIAYVYDVDQVVIYVGNSRGSVPNLVQLLIRSA